MKTVRILLGVVAMGALGAACGAGSHTADISGATANPTRMGPGSTPLPFPTGTPGPSDPTPTPTPAPAPTPVSGGSGVCSFLWANQYSDGSIDYYEVDLRGTYWSNATTAFFPGDDSVGYFVLGFDPFTGGFLQAGMATSGAIALSVSTTAAGIAANFADAAPHTYFDATALFAGQSQILGGPVGTQGTGSFTGALSSPVAGVSVTPGSGTMTFTINGIQGTIGGIDPGTLDYALCRP